MLMREGLGRQREAPLPQILGLAYSKPTTMPRSWGAHGTEEGLGRVEGACVLCVCGFGDPLQSAAAPLLRGVWLALASHIGRGFMNTFFFQRCWMQRCLRGSSAVVDL